MGSSKALLDAGGDPFLSRALQALRGGGCDPVVVVLALPDGPEADLATREGARVLHNVDPSEGPISSLRLALAHLPPDVIGCVYLPVDHPLVKPATVAELVARFLEALPALAVPVTGGCRGHPPVFHRTLFGALSAPDLRGGARTVVRALGDRVLEVPVDDPGILADLDTPQAYRRAFPAPEES